MSEFMSDLAYRMVRGGASRALPCLLIVSLAAATGCRRGEENEPTTPDEATEERSLPNLNERERCAAEGGTPRGFDANGDGVPEIVDIFRDGARYCRNADLNFDGVVDATTFFLEDGVAIRRAEFDRDFDGRIDDVLIYEEGRLVRKEFDTNFDHVIDTWVYCDDEGRALHVDRDRSNRGEPDMSEIYEEGVITRVEYDDNHDGRPEKWEIYEGGRLVAYEVDDDADGEADVSTPVSREVAGDPEEPIFCTVEAAEHAREAAAEAEEAAAEARASASEGEEDGGSAGGDGHAADAADAPWAGASDVSEDGGEGTDGADGADGAGEGDLPETGGGDGATPRDTEAGR